MKVKKDLSVKRVNIKKDTTASKDRKSKLENLHSISNDTNRMIIYTLILNFFYRIPELVFYMHLVFIQGLDITIHNGMIQRLVNLNYYKLCYVEFCELLASLIEFIYLISYSFNIYFYFSYNKPFRAGFNSLFNIKKRRTVKNNI